MSPPLDTDSELQTISQLLHLTYHRNKNQHRLAKWWSSFGQLRRSLIKLLTELEDEKSPSSLSRLKKGKRRKRGEQMMSRVEHRVEFMLEVLIPRCYLAFSGIVADNQWAVLGLMLLANLARLQRLIAPLRKEMTVEGGKEEILVAAGLEEDLGQSVSREEVQKARPEQEDGEDEDKDEEDEALKSKSEKEAKEKKRKLMAQTSQGKPTKPTPLKPPKKKRKKGGDAFDDLFDTLM